MKFVFYCVSDDVNVKVKKKKTEDLLEKRKRVIQMVKEEVGLLNQFVVHCLLRVSCDTSNEQLIFIILDFPLQVGHSSFIILAPCVTVLEPSMTNNGVSKKHSVQKSQNSYNFIIA